MTPAQLRAALKRLGLSQRGFARLTGVNVRTVTRWLAGKRPRRWVRLLLEAWIREGGPPGRRGNDS